MTVTMAALSPPKHRTDAGWLGTRRRSIVAQASRYLGALAVLATGIAHIEQYSVDDYSTVPTIGTLFLVNFVAAIVIAVGLIAPSGASPGATPISSARPSPSAGSGSASSHSPRCSSPRAAACSASLSTATE
jgi:hypothetical protein